MIVIVEIDCLRFKFVGIQRWKEEKRNGRRVEEIGWDEKKEDYKIKLWIWGTN